MEQKQLRNELEALISAGEIRKKDVLAALDECERFGRQHIYFFKIPESHLKKLRDATYVENVCEELGLDHVFNAETSCVLPEKPEVAKITLNADWLVICWAEKKRKLEPLRKWIDNSSGREVCITEQLIAKFRAIVSFQVFLVTGDAELMISTQPSGSDYDKVKEPYLKQLDDWFKLGLLQHLDLSDTIKTLEKSDEVMVRELDLRTPMGSQIEIVSQSRSHGIYDDQEVQNARSNLPSAQDNAINCYWFQKKSDGALQQDLRTRVYQDRIAFMRECKQQEVEYVLQKIRDALN